MARVTISMEDTLKDKVQSLRDQFRVKTDYEAIETLIAKYAELQELRKKTDEERIRNNARIDNEMLILGPDRKKTYIALKKELGLGSDVSVLDFLLIHYENSSNIDKKTFDVFRQLN